MKNTKMTSLGIGTLLLLTMSCKKFLSIDNPIDQINTNEVYSNNETANSAVRGIYSQMMSQGGFASGNETGVTLLAGRSADDFRNISSTVQYIQFSDNSISSLNSDLRSGLWRLPYQYIYYSNAVLENLERSKNVSTPLKQQLSGEAKFIRAFCYFYLTNLFGQVPLVTTTDYRINAAAKASTKDDIYNKITNDLIEAKSQLSESYPISGRVRVNKSAATAMLARVYLYRKDWANAEKEATKIISKTDQYQIEDDLDQVFLKSSKEAILQFAVPAAITVNTFEGARFIITTDGAEGSNQVVLSDDLLGAFEPGDKRFKKWVGTFTKGTMTFKYPFKYKVKVDRNPYNEDSMVLRLAEQYLIRAEARINQNNIIQGINDLNILRTRAREVPTSTIPNPLPAISTTLSKNDALLAVEKERRIELFSEWGHRWLDLKRTDRASAALTPIKGVNWQGTDVLYPIPAQEILNNPNLFQNAGYQ